VAAGDIVVVVGRVGSGKSSLIHALLGEMRLHSGRPELRGRIALAGQSCWVRNASLKDNAAFGRQHGDRRAGHHAVRRLASAREFRQGAVQGGQGGNPAARRHFCRRHARW